MVEFRRRLSCLFIALIVLAEGVLFINPVWIYASPIQPGSAKPLKPLENTALSYINIGVFDSHKELNTGRIHLPIVRRAGTTVCGEIASDTTWTLIGNPYLITCDVIVPTGVTLTIDAGVTIQFQNVHDDLIIDGRLQALGTQNVPVLFQPLNDTRPGRWGNVGFRESSSGVLDHVILEYGGSGDCMLHIASDTVQVINSVVQHSADRGIMIEIASPLISATQILDNTGDEHGGGMYTYSGNPIVQNNTFSGNSANSGGGLYIAAGNPTVQNNTFMGNTVEYVGGGIYIGSGNPIIQNNVFIGNVAVRGGGIENYEGNPIIQNNTFTANIANVCGGGVDNYNGKPTIRSNIVVDNTAIEGGGVFSFWDLAIIDFNDVWNNTGGNFGSYITPGAHNISVNPLLVDPANGDFHLAHDSQCINAGDPVIYPLTDFEGDPRPQGKAPDIGADEYRPRR